MHKQVWMAFGLLALVGCGGGTGGDANPAPGAPGHQAGNGNLDSGKVPSLIDPGNFAELCKQGQSMWLDKCYDEIRVVVRNGVSCRDEGGVANNSTSCPEFRAKQASFSFVSSGKEEFLWSLGDKISPLLQAARFSLDEKREEYLFWESPLMLDPFSLSKIPFSSILTSHPDTSKIEDSILLAVNRIDFMMSYIMRDSALMGRKIPYRCPSRGKLIIDDVEINLPASKEEFFRKVIQPSVGSGVNDGLGVNEKYEKIDDEQCLRDKENVLSTMEVDEQEGWQLPYFY